MTPTSIKSKKAFSLATMLSCSVMLAATAGAATYYVDSVGGLDINNGTSTATPWKSLTKINATTFVGGDNVLFKRGSSWSGTLIPKGSGTSTAQLVFDAYGTGAAPIINGAGAPEAVMLWSKNYFTFQNFNVTNDAASDGPRIGIHLTLVGAAAPSGISTFKGVKILNNEIHHVHGITVRAQGVYSTAALYVDMQDYQGAQTLVQDLLVEGNDFHDNKCIGFYMKAPANYNGRPDLWATNFKIRSNIFDQGGADHIVINGADAPLIEGNAGYDAGILSTHPAGSYIAGMWTCYFTKDAVFQYNEVARTHNESINGASGDSQAFDADLGTTGNQIFQYNYSHDNDGGVLIMMPDASIAKTVIYRYNLSVNDGRNTNSGCQLAVYPTYGVNSLYVYNNVFYTTRQEGFKFRDFQACYYYNNIFNMPAAIYASKPTFSNNLYFGHNPEVTDLYKVVADPKFVGPLPTTTGGDGYIAANTDVFKLLSTSPAINAGKSISSPIGNGGLDFWGNALHDGGFADIGAQEFVGGTAPAPAAVTITDSAAVTYTGSGWLHSTDTLYYNSTKSVSSTVGDYMQFGFTGTNVALFGRKGPALGKVNISVDGGAAVLVDCYWPVDLFQVQLYQVSGLSNSAHTIKSTVATKNPASSYNALAIDYFLQAPGTPPSAPLLANVDDVASASVVYTGAWTATTGDTVSYAGTRTYSSTVGNYVDFTFTGTGVRIFGNKASTQGKVSVSIDGGAPTVVNCYQPTLVDYQVRLFEVNGLTLGTHTVRATVATKDAASTGNVVCLDLFQTLTGGAVAAPVIVDNPAGAAVAYTGTWTHSSDVNYYNSTKSVSGTIGDYVTFTFTGTGVSLYAKKDSILGKLSVQIDGGTATLVDTYASSVAYQVQVYTVSGLSPGTHTLKATVAAKNPVSSGNFIGVDYFKYQP